MANQEHIDVLKQGVEAWNQWRQEHLDIQPDLTEANLSGVNLYISPLSDAYLSRADLRADLTRTYLDRVIFGRADFKSANHRADFERANFRADLSRADLSGADLSRADLRRADLSGADLSRADLRGANLSDADLSSATLTETNLSKADLDRANFYAAKLVGAYLSGASTIEAKFSNADLRGADLSDANLSGVNFGIANLSGANLSGANLSGADLSRADLSRADLSDADFSRVRLWSTIFAWVDLLTVKGLDTLIHNGPSIIDIKTVVLPQDNARKHFLRNTGFPDTFIDYLPSLLSPPIQYHSVFISYSSKDDPFARKLYTDLQESGVRCWFASEDLKVGDLYHQRIDESIRLYDKLILILSGHAVQSSWVEREVVAAREKEDRGSGPVLFPVRLDDAVMSTTKAWAADVRRRWHIGDFTQWKQHDAYQKAFERILRDLKAEHKPKG